LERFGDLQDPAIAQEEAISAANNEKQIRALLIEERSLAKRVGGRPSTLKLLRDDARRIIAGKRVRDLKPGRYRQAAARAARLAVEAFEKGEIREAQAEKRRQMLNMALEAEAREQLARVGRVVKYQTRFDKKTTREKIGLAGHTYLEQIDALRERFDFRKSVPLKADQQRQSLRKFIEEREAEHASIVIPDRIRDEAYKKPYREMTVGGLLELRDSLQNVEHLAKLKLELLTSLKRRTFDELKEDAIYRIGEHARRDEPRVIETRTPEVEDRRALDDWFAMHRKFASLIREMDGLKEEGGPIWEALVRTLNAAGDYEALERVKATERLITLMKPYLTFGQEAKQAVTMVTRGRVDAVKPDLLQKAFIPGANVSLTKQGRLMFAFQWGTATNRQRIMGGYSWARTEGQARAVLDTLTKQDWDFVQALWDFVDEYWAAVAAKEKRVTGVVAEKVERVPVQTKFGEYPGGYAPIKYDERQSPRAYADVASDTAKRMMAGNYSRATTKRSHTKARVEEVYRPVRLDFGVVFEHLGEVIHDLAFHEWLIDANRFLGDREIQGAIIEHFGQPVYTTLQRAVSDIAAGDVPAQIAWERAVNWLRMGSSIAGMGYNLITAFLQPFGLTQSMARIGPKWVAKGLSRWMRDAASMENTVKWIHENSVFMRLRSKTQQREINEIQNKILKGGKLTALNSTYFYLIVKMQQIADNPTWLGMYEKMMELEGKDHATAVALADQAVIDSQGGGQIKDLAEIQRGGPLRKLWTNFYHFFSTTLGLTAESYRRTNFKHPAEVGRFAVDMLLIYTIPAVMTALMRDMVRGDELPDDDRGWAEYLIRENLGYMAGTMVGTRELSSGLTGYFGYDGPAGTRFFSSFGRSLEQVTQGEVDAALLKALNSAAGVLFHYPAVFTQRLAEGTIALSEGETERPTALLVGPPRKRR
jgi:hypothetical protein